MLSVKIDQKRLISILKPAGPLSENDFQSLAKAVDPLIEKFGQLNGILIYTKSFPGWDSFAAFRSHLRFVRHHHKNVSQIALVTDSLMGKFAKSVISHFVKAEIRLFAYRDYAKATQWLIGNKQK